MMTCAKLWGNSSATAQIARTLLAFRWLQAVFLIVRRVKSQYGEAPPNFQSGDLCGTTSLDRRIIADAVAGCTSTVTCSFSDNAWHFCQADTREGARLVKQTNVAACVAGKTWGWDEKGIWVNQGCGGQFALDRGDTSAHRASAAPLRPASDQAQDRIEEAAPTTEESCEKAIGKKEAGKLVDECLQVSPATPAVQRVELVRAHQG